MADQVTSSLAEAKILVMQGMKGDTGEKGDKGDKGDTGAAGIKGDKGDKGDRGESLRVNSSGHVTYWDEELQQWVDTGIEVEGVPGPKGDPGEDGEDGFSPTVTTSAITGGNRVTITDANGAHSFDVMDGASGITLLQVIGNEVRYYGTTNTISAAGIRAIIDNGNMPFLCYYGTGDGKDWHEYVGGTSNDNNAIFENAYHRITVADDNGVTSVRASQKPALPSAGTDGNVLTASGGKWVSAAPSGGDSITVDSALSTTSENPVQNKVVTGALNEKYVKPSGGIPATDLTQAVQTSLGKADRAIQSPTVTASDYNKFLSVDADGWLLDEPLPVVTTTDNGKVLTVVGGEWSAESPYVQLPYLEADGQSYIDTGVLPSSLLGIDVGFQLSSSDVIEKAERQYVFGTYSSAEASVDSRMQFFYGGSAKVSGKNVFCGYGNGTAYVTLTPDAARHRIELDEGLFFADVGEDLANLSENSSFQNPLPIFLLACNTPDGAKYLADGMRIFSAKFYTSENLVLDLIPVRMKATGAVGMWDKVTNAFFPLQTVTPAGSLPDTTSASAGDVLTLNSGKTPVWQAPSGGGSLPSGGTEGQVLTKTANGEAWQDAPTELPSVTASDNGKSLVVENGAWGKGYQAVRIPRVAMASTDTTPTIDPNKLYVFPEMAILTITLAAITDNSIVNEFHFIFESGATATTLTLPATILQPDGFTVEANMHYEVSILEGAMTAQGWAVTA